jgi:hypothetical protein
MSAQLTRFRRSRLGATLAEGILAVFISSMFLSVLPGFYLTSVKVWQRESSQLEAIRTADFAIRRMEEDVRNARRAIVSSNGATLVLVLPARTYDAGLGREVNALDASGYLVDGDLIQYYLTSSPGADAMMYRRVVQSDGTVEPAEVVATHVAPQLNPLDTDGFTRPMFAFDSDEHTVSVVVTAAEPKASTGTFAPTQTAVKCTRDGGALARVATEEHPEGEIQCVVCGTSFRTSAEMRTYETRFLLRNE